MTTYVNVAEAATGIATVDQAKPARPRLDSIDLLRGVVMVVMVLDHTRDFVHGAAAQFEPTDLARTTTLLFFTRWITHYCAPVFVFLAGTGAYLQTLRGATTRELSTFLLSRGIWLIVLEGTAVRTGTFFNLDYSFFAFMQVIWAIGASMIVLAALVHLPMRAIALFGLAMIAVHNLFDGVRVQGWQGPGTPIPSGWAMLWIVLHQSGEMFPVAGQNGPVALVMYPLVPWIGVMAAGYVFGVVYTLDAERRRRVLLRLGAGLTVGFVVLRASNVYGDPSLWQTQPTTMFTVLSFLNTTKYPPSLLFLLMTLGPAIIALALLESTRPRGAAAGACVMFGRVPLFFYLLQWPLVHTIAVVISFLAGKDVGYLFLNPPAFFVDRPPDAGFSLAMVYVCWVVAILILFPLCRWFAEVKRTHHAPWLRYL